jgi:phosphoglycerate dehydrogenase-like enzyme
MTKQIAVLDDYQHAAEGLADWASLPECTTTFFQEHIADPDALVAALEPFEIVCAMRERTAFPRAVLERLPNLKFLVTTGPFNAVIDIEAAAELGIIMSGTLGTPTPTPELTWALILALARQVPREDAGVRAGKWQQTVGTELAGRTLGLAGLGRQGLQVAPVGKAFGMDVIAWSQNLTQERAEAAGVRLVTRDELFEQSDFLSVHLVLSDRSRHTVGEAELRAMKPSAYLINTSRGPLVDEAALITALDEGWIAGAGLDVFDIEPIPTDSPLLRAPNTILTPHLGYVADKNYRVFYGDTVDDIAAYLAGSPIRLVERAPNR